ncbi:nucleoside diphosphate kinase [Verticillium alfalfae VaMs.102]|uniref:Nucleoside diphosphate kinase n=1 Tax=Verticillium alfalfae (strain VaMs.102 / ATCC MYA-4576 / FGSC 10136) TaxID=526221 RepID=C9SRZ3_VERA1|nr:nucleoside diphosphate kinase [Verticillium alfalfae VaMs.102]EEY21558.1 nucleoside diphosphate kinase [Verticillium alfalfae VaMs.102]
MAQPLHPQKLVKEAQSTPPHAAQQAPKNWFGYLLFALSFSLLLYVHTYDFFHPDDHLQATANTFIPQLKNLPVPQTDIMSSAEQTFKLAAIKLVSPSKEHLEQHSILGATNPLASSPGTIRGDYAIDVGRNVCHGSDSVENAKKEIALWFKEGDLVQWKSAAFDWIYEKA